MKAKVERRKSKGKGNLRHGTAAAVVAAALCGGCGPLPYIMEGNYLTYEHSFTDASLEAVRKSAERLCRQRDEAALETSRSCSLTRCTTSYQCMSDDDARRLAGEKKK
jgi:hypothetical protein